MSKKTKQLEQIIKRLTRHNFAEGAYLLSREDASIITAELKYKIELCNRRHNHYMKHQEAEIQRAKDYQSAHYDEIKVKRHEAYLEQKRQWLAESIEG